MKQIFALCLFAALNLHAITCQESVKRLKDGNDRYVRDTLEHPNRSSERREAIAAKQTPFAIVVGCSDSRVSPEILFDQGVGDLFIVRVAGNVIGPLELESIEYAMLHLGAMCVVIMGHENCGAVKAVVDGQTQDIETIAKLITPAVKEAKQSDPTHLLPAAIKENALRMRDYLLNTKVIKQLAQKQKISVHATYYDLNTGAVEWLPVKNR